MYVEQTDNRKYALQDLTMEELLALRRAIENTHLPDKGVLARLHKHLASLPEIK